jgi:hypothetical protein
VPVTNSLASCLVLLCVLFFQFQCACLLVCALSLFCLCLCLCVCVLSVVVACRVVFVVPVLLCTVPAAVVVVFLVGDANAASGKSRKTTQNNEKTREDTRHEQTSKRRGAVDAHAHNDFVLLCVFSFLCSLSFLSSR